MLYVVAGVRGAGKTTLIENIRKANIGHILQPSTTRLPRFEGEAEYEFVPAWSRERYAWSISVGEHNYGVRISEIEKAAKAPAFTVFEPISIDTFYDYRRNSGLAALTIGLNTVSDVAEQHVRVCMSASRMMTAEQFALATRNVRGADVVIAGDEHEVLRRIKELVAAHQASNAAK